MTRTDRSGIPLIWKIILPLLPFAAMISALCIGRISVSPADLGKSLSAKLHGMDPLNPQIEMVLWKIRFPRILLALLAGAGLSVSGNTYQSLFTNPLASPDTLGVASGASFGAALGLLFGWKLLSVQMLSVGFGLIAVGITILVGLRPRQRTFSSVVLSGIMISSLFTALISLVKFSADTDNQLPAITYFLMGNLSAANYRMLSVGAPIILIGILILFLLRWRMNMLSLSEEEARSFGVNLIRLRTVTIICATAVTASCISMCGQVGWVGLIVPHMARMKFGSNQLSLMPSCIFIGAAFMVIVDTAARSISAAELPISILTAMIGAPFFILLMGQTEGGTL